MTNTLIARNPIQLRQVQQQTQELIEQSEKDLESENNKIQKATDELQSLDKQITSLKLEGGSKKDVQTFKFVADEFGVNINKVVKWFIVALISVFDPLAVCLLLAYNTAIAKSVEEKTPEISVISEGTPVTNTETISTISQDIPPVETVSTESNPQPPSPPSKTYPFSF